MSFKQKHPYLFWQLIGWGILLADFAFLTVSAVCYFGEWCYPVMVFAFIGALITICVSPIIVHFKRRKDMPQSENGNKQLNDLIRTKINAITMARKSPPAIITAVSAALSIPILGATTYYLGEYVNLALGFAGIVLMSAVPCVIVGVYFSNITRKFFKVKNGEKYVDIIRSEDVKELAETNPRTLLMVGEASDILLNFLYNWLRYYLKAERLTLYRITAPDLCRDFQPSEILSYEDVLLCIPTEQFDLIKEKGKLFERECEIIGAFPFRAFVIIQDNVRDPGNQLNK